MVDTLRGHLQQRYPTESLVFRNAHGQPLRRSAFWTEWRWATRAASLHDVRFHELRHYYACGPLPMRRANAAGHRARGG